MTSPSTPSTPIRFGPYEVNARTGELRKHGACIRLSGQPFQILLLLLSRPLDLVTRDELREQVWREGTFVDFEHGLNAAINKLRRALGDSADRPRYVETVPGRGYRFIGSFERQADASPSNAGPVSEATAQRRRMPAVWWLMITGTGCLSAVVGLMSWLDMPSPRTAPWILTRLTSDFGSSDDPALSPDGTLLAYSSDRDVPEDRVLFDGGRDLYLKHVAGGSPIRLTFDGAGNATPQFSGDGSRLVFRSNRDGGGIYEMPALGGDARLIARDGFNPRFSPDGLQVAYWVGTQSTALSVPGSGEVRVVPVRGGRPQAVGSVFQAARYPIWHKDGKQLLMIGYTSDAAFDGSRLDWWVVPTDGSAAVRVGLYQALLDAGLEPRGRPRTPVPSLPEPRCWSAADQVTFAMMSGDSWNLWQIEVSARTGKVVGSPTRLTTSAGNDVRASCPSTDSVAFARVETSTHMWLLPFDLNRGASTGLPQRMTQGPLWHETPSLARNGDVLAFSSDRNGRANIWLRELGSGKEVTVAASPSVQRFPLINAAGTRIAFSVYEKDKRVLYMFEPGAAPERICDGCLRATDWSRDEGTLVVYGGDPYQVGLLDLASRQVTPLVAHHRYPVLYGLLSPDNRWISFTARVEPARGRIAIAPAVGPRPVPESAWIKIADAGQDDYANWSPDGQTLYFTAARDGYSCLWGQRIDADAGGLLGEPFAIQHFHGRLSFEHGGWSAAGGRIAVPLVERTGNVWLLSRANQ